MTSSGHSAMRLEVSRMFTILWMHCCVPRCTNVKTRRKSCHPVPHEETTHLKGLQAIVPPEEADSNFKVNKVKNKPSGL